MAAIAIYSDFGAPKNKVWTPYTKINSQWIKDINVRAETIKLLEENISRTLDDINQSKILYDTPPRVMEIKTKVNKWDLIKLKSFWTAKESINKVKRQPTEWIVTEVQWISGIIFIQMLFSLSPDIIRTHSNQRN